MSEYGDRGSDGRGKFLHVFHLVPVWVDGSREAVYKPQTPLGPTRIRGGSYRLLDLVLRLVSPAVSAPRLRTLDEGDRDLLDPVPVHLEDVEAKPVVGDVVAGLGRAPELAEDEAGDRVEVLLRYLGAEPDRKSV